MAQTYRNHVVLVGVGHVGLRITRTLAQMGFEIVVVDSSLDKNASDELEILDIPAVIDDAGFAVLTEAGQWSW